ncbi:MAG: tripartite tricarboxylate transporter substrate-binding protein, partial [Betaproteobacteria bacterium]|nr:tripartite tricarboxylate transporter substrate-binding protein [Betaproteobacteria bacterium]
MHRFVYAAIGGLALMLAGPVIAAEKFPDRPIRVVVPFPPGGNVDVFARVLYLEVEKNLGTNIVIDNRGGANGLIGADIVKNATPNGYTFLNVSFSFAVNPAIRKEMPFDIEKDFAPITNVALGLGYLLVVNPKTTIMTVKDLIDQSKTGQLRYSTAGVGNGQHLAGALFTQAAGIKMLHVPYKGGGPASIAAVGGEVQVHFPAASVGIPHHKAGRLRAIAFTGAKRLDSLPDVPTIGETVKGFVFDSGWHGTFAPAGTPMRMSRRS